MHGNPSEAVEEKKMTETEYRPREKFVDSAEPGTIREKLLEVGWQQRRLYSGDYWFFSHDFKKVGITRKTVDDLLGSLSGSKAEDGKRRYPLPKQLEEMLDEYPLKIILLEGSWKWVSPNQTIVSGRGIEYHTWSMVWNFLRRWFDKGFTLELTVNEGHTIQRLNELYALYQKPYSLSSATKDFTDDRVLAFPSGCRGKTALNCIAYFSSLVDVAVAAPEELQKVQDVGEKKAWLIYNHFHKGEVETGVGATSERLEAKTEEQVSQGELWKEAE